MFAGVHRFPRLAMLLLLAGCVGNFTSQVTPGYEPPPDNQVAVVLLDHPDAAVANAATAALEQQLRACGRAAFIPAARTAQMLERYHVVIPRRFISTDLGQIKDALPVRFLLTGGVTTWKKGSIGFRRATATEVAVSLTMFDLTDGRVVWSASGHQEGGRGILAESPAVKAGVIIHRLLTKWEGFCHEGTGKRTFLSFGPGQAETGAPDRRDIHAVKHSVK